MSSSPDRQSPTDRNIIFERSESDEEDELIELPCFEISPDVQEKEEPTNGDEFLLKVIKERENIPAVARCSVDIYPLNKGSGSVPTEVKKKVKQPIRLKLLKPTTKWQREQKEDFIKLRKYVRRMTVLKEEYLETIFQDRYTPFLKDEEIQWEEVFERVSPGLSHILVLKHNSIETAMEVLLSRLEKVSRGDSIDHKTALWLHSILTVVRYPPHPDECYILRCIAKKCAEIRAALYWQFADAEELSKPMNLFICIVAMCFGQHDLGDYQVHDSRIGVLYYESEIKQVA